MAQTDVLLTKEPTPQAVPACELPRKVYDVARNAGACLSSGLATAGFRSAKYLADEWSQNCYARYHQAFVDRDQSERWRHESQQLVAKTQALARRSQDDATRKAGARLQDTHGWKSELQREVRELGAESDLLLAQKQRLARALDATSVPFSIATDNLQCRERRQHPDLVRDCVETELLKVRGPFRSQTRHARRPPPSPGSVTCTGPGWAGSRGASVLVLQEAELIRNIQELLKRTIMEAVNQIRWVSVFPHPLGWLWAGSWGEQAPSLRRWGLVPGLRQGDRPERGTRRGWQAPAWPGAWASRGQAGFAGQRAAAPGHVGRAEPGWPEDPDTEQMR